MSSERPSSSAHAQVLAAIDRPPARAVFNVPRAVIAMALALFAPLLLGVDPLGWFHASHQTRWSGAIYDRLTAAAATDPSPKILIVGSSSVIFGVHARSLSERLGLPVLAWGLNAGIGSDLIAEGASRFIREGDTVVYAPEHVQFMISRRRGDPALRSDWLQLHESAIDDPIGRFPMRLWIAARARAQRLRRTAENAWTSAILDAIRSAEHLPPADPGSAAAYELSTLDARGNLVFPRPAPPSQTIWQTPADDPSGYDIEESRGARGLRILADACRERRARLFICGPIWTPSPTDTPEFIARTQACARAWLDKARSLGAEVLLTPEQTTLPPEDVYDITGHLNDRGVAALEEELVRALAPVIGRDRAPAR